MKKIIITVIACLLLTNITACTQSVIVQQESKVTQASSPSSMAEGNLLSSSATHPRFHSHSNFANYTDWIATELVHNASVDLTTNIIVVTSFGYQGRITEQNHQLSAELSEHIAHDLQPFGVRTISAYQNDMMPYHDATGVVLNIETIERLKTFNAPLVLTGVVIPNDHGIIVHAKVFDIATRSMVASANKFIPFYTTKT